MKNPAKKASPIQPTLNELKIVGSKAANTKQTIAIISKIVRMSTLTNRYSSYYTPLSNVVRSITPM